MAMNGAEAPAGAKPLTVGEILSAAFDLYRRQAVALWTIVAVVVIPAEALIVIVERLILSGGRSQAINGTIYTTDSTGLLAIVVIVITFLSVIVTIGALSKCLLDAYTGHPSGWRHSLQFAADRVGPLAWLSIICGVLLAIGYILLVIPGIFLTVSLIAAVPALMFEGTSPFASLRRSYDLVQGRWWATFGALVLAIIALIGISIVLGALFGGVGSSSHISLILVIGGISRIIAALVTYPIVAAVSAVIYIDLRVRKEHVDPRELTGAGEASGTAGLPLA
jgi:hypothetical protein